MINIWNNRELRVNEDYERLIKTLKKVLQQLKKGKLSWWIILKIVYPMNFVKVVIIQTRTERAIVAE